MVREKLCATLLLIALSPLAGCEKEEVHAEARKQDDGPARVEVARAAAGNLKSDWRFLAQAKPALQVELATAVEGHVLKVVPREGDRVEQGEAVITLDSRKARATLQAARARAQGSEAELDQARRQYGRVKDVQTDAISDPERESFELDVARLEATLEAQRADVQRLEVEVAQHSLRAPFAGVVKERKVDPGAWVERGDALLELVSLEELEVHVDVSAEIGTRLSVGDSATLWGPAGEPEVAARIAGIVPALDSTTRTMRVRLLPEERPTWLLAGLALEAAFEVELSGGGVLVPRDALLRGPVETRVVVVEGGKSRSITVEVVASAGAQLLVRGEGLAEGASIVVRGNERLKPGQAVEVAP